MRVAWIDAVVDQLLPTQLEMVFDFLAPLIVESIAANSCQQTAGDGPPFVQASFAPEGDHGVDGRGTASGEPCGQ
jgi:hypothetical protein